jgi:hypothetical protein
MGLAMLRNTGKLGEEPHEVFEGAVLAWHMMHEILAEAEWRKLRAVPANLDAFLRRWQEAAARADAGKEADRELPAELEPLFRIGLRLEDVRALTRLSDEQRHALLFLASPPRIELAPARPEPLGGLDLLDIEGPAITPLSTFHGLMPPCIASGSATSLAASVVVSGSPRRLNGSLPRGVKRDESIRGGTNRSRRRSTPISVAT